MKFLRGDKVNFMGAIMMMPKGNTMVETEMNPVNNTYVHYIFAYDNEYHCVIAHKDGVPKPIIEMFLMNIPNTDVSDIDATGNYVICNIDYLEMVQPYAYKNREAEEAKLYPKEVNTEQAIQEDISSEDVLSDDIPSDDIPSEDIPQEITQEPIIEPKEEQPITSAGNMQDPTEGIYPHFTPQSMPQAAMIQVVRKPLVFSVMKVTTPFTVVTISGVNQRGTAGDYVAANGAGMLSVISKNDFDSEFEALQDIPVLEIGEQRYNIPSAIYEHIVWLRKENDKLRTELYLKNGGGENDESSI